MFLLFYCLVSITRAIASNETRNGNRRSINDCSLLTDKARTSQLGKLFESKLVNIVDLRIARNNYYETIFIPLQLTLVNMVGLKITLWLDSYPFAYSKDLTSTLNAGRRSFELHAYINYKGCVGRGFSSRNFVYNLLQQLQGNDKLTTHEICYRPHVNSTQRCCQSINHPSKTKCHEVIESLKLHRFHYAMLVLVVLFSFLFYTWLYAAINSYRFHKARQKYYKYYELTESPLSLSSVISSVIWEEFGYIGFVARNVIFLGFFLWLLYWMWRNLIQIDNERTSDFFFFLIFLMPHIILVILPLTDLITLTQSSEMELALFRLRFPNSFSNFLTKLAYYLEYDIRDMNWVSETLFDNTLKIISLPLNMKQWKVSFVKFYIKNRNLYCNNSHKKRVFHIFIPFIYFLYICIVFISLLILLVQCTFDFVLKQSCKAAILVLFLNFVYSVLIFSSFIFLYLVVPPLFMGILFNIVYFIPYIALFAVMAFYSFNFWKPYEEKYFALKKMIYEECRDNAYKERYFGTIRRQKGRNTKLLPVVSRKLYNKIRERLLPYHTTLFYYSVTVATLIIPFSTILYGELETLREIDVTPAINFLITLMIGALPYAYNLIIHARDGEDWKAAWKEEIKINVKCIVQDNPHLAKTILVILPDGTVDDDSDDEGNDNGEQPVQEMVVYETSI